jgi:hypothetical protein
MPIEWYGQSAFRLTDGSAAVFIDPFADMTPILGGGGSNALWDNSRSLGNHRCAVRCARTSRTSWSVCVAGSTSAEGERNALVP